MIKQAKPAAEAKQQARISVARCARLVHKFVGYLGLRSAARGFALLHPRLISIARLRRSRCAKIWVMTSLTVGLLPISLKVFETSIRVAEPIQFDPHAVHQ